MATALDITGAFLDDILAKLQDTVTPPTADETSNLLNQYQTLTQLIRDGYQWTAEDLEDLPTVLRAELDAWKLSFESETVSSINPIIVTDLNDSKENGFYFCDSGCLNNPYASYFTVQVCGNNNNIVSQIAINCYSGATFTRAWNTTWSAWVQL